MVRALRSGGPRPVVKPWRSFPATFRDRKTIMDALRHLCAESLAGKMYDRYIRLAPPDEHRARPTSEACVMLRARRYRGIGKRFATDWFQRSGLVSPVLAASKILEVTSTRALRLVTGEAHAGLIEDPA